MATTQSGFEVLYDYGDPALLPNPVIPGSMGVQVLGGLRRGDPASVFLHVAARFYREVFQFKQSDGVWGFTPKQITGGSGWSNHAGGVAIDLASARFPQGGSKMSVPQVQACRSIVNEVNGLGGGPVIDWGGEWSGKTKDQMHFQLHGNVSRLMLSIAAQKILNGPTPNPKPGTYPPGYGVPVPKQSTEYSTGAGWVKPKWPFPAGTYIGPLDGPAESISGAGKNDARWRPHIMVPQRYLKALGYYPGSIDGIYGKQMAGATVLFQRNYNGPTGKLVADGLIGSKTWSAMGLRVKK